MESLNVWRTDLIDTPERFRALESEYVALLQRSSANSVFLTWEWLSTWMDVFGSNAKPFVILVRDEADRLLAAAPLKIAYRSGKCRKRRGRRAARWRHHRSTQKPVGQANPHRHPQRDGMCGARGEVAGATWTPGHHGSRSRVSVHQSSKHLG
jgi:hypothetical protein